MQDTRITVPSERNPDELLVIGSPEEVFQIYPIVEIGSFPPHRHTFYEITYFARGGGILRTPTQEIPIEPPQVHVCAMGDAWHEIICNDQGCWATSIAVYPRLLLHDGQLDKIDVPEHHDPVIQDSFSCLQQLADLATPITTLKLPAARRIERLIMIMCEEYRLRLPGYLVRLRASIEELLIIVIREQLGVHVHPSIVEVKTDVAENSSQLGKEIQLDRDKRVASAIHLMKTNLHDVLPNQTIAEAVHLTEKHFVRLFSNEVGISPQRYHLRLRLEAAAVYLVNTEMSINEISKTFGYKHPSHFHRRFREYYGTTPSLYRYFNRQQTT
ncbi:helix-turn-helix domain-containing protein [Poriferisphaera sp. WC338]|uniref:helix-turn-helix domain-containing protein n=1 Tax=Poriferisphaera sp. WC338 TaxID=3425129 RepID=UPI003D8184D1